MKGFIFAEQLFDGDTIHVEWASGEASKVEYARVQNVWMSDIDVTVYLINNHGMEFRRVYDRKDSVEIVE